MRRARGAPDVSAKSLAENGWVRLAERIAVILVAAGLAAAGKLLFDLSTAVTKITTIQEQTIVPGLGEVKDELTILTDNLLNRPRFDKDDSERLDDAHRKIMEGHDARLRALEKREGWRE